MSGASHHRHGTATDAPTGALLAPAGYVVLEKMRWRTPAYVVDDLAERVHPGRRFDLDAAAEDAAHHADRYITMDEDALTCDWQADWRGPRLTTPDPAPIRSAFINPPYAAASTSKAAREAFPNDGLIAFPGTARFVERSWEWSRTGITVCALLGASMDQWLQSWCRRADEVLFGPRLQFLDLQNVPQKSPPSSHIALIFRPHVPTDGWPGGPRVIFGWDPRPAR